MIFLYCWHHGREHAVGTECPVCAAEEIAQATPSALDAREYTGGSVSYYQVRVSNPTTPGRDPYTAECNDVIEALGMTYAEGNAFKAIWRACAARTLGLSKRGYDDAVYDAEKVEFFGKRMVEQRKAEKNR